MKKRHIQLIIGLLLSIFFLYLSFKRVEFIKLWETLKSIQYVYVIPFTVITLFSMYLRAIRWKYFLLPKFLFDSKKLFSPLIIGFALNGLFPGRVGEFARPYILYKKDNVPFATGLATVVVERIFDTITILIMLATALYLLPPFDPKICITWDNSKQLSGSEIINIIRIILALTALLFLVFLYILRPSSNPKSAFLKKINSNPKTKMKIFIMILIAIVICLAGIIYHSIAPPLSDDMTYTFGKKYDLNGETLQHLTKKTSMLIGVVVVGTFLFMINKTRKLMQYILMKLPLVPIKTKEFFNRLIEHFAEGLSSLQNPKYIFWIIFHSVFIWFTVGLSLWIMGFGFQDFPMSLSKATATMVIICIAITIPAAPGYWGLYEYGCIFALKVLNVTQDDSVAMGYSLLIHGFQMIPIIIIGLMFAFKEQISISEISTKQEETEEVENTV